MCEILFYFILLFYSGWVLVSNYFQWRYLWFFIVILASQRSKCNVFGDFLAKSEFICSLKYFHCNLSSFSEFLMWKLKCIFTIYFYCLDGLNWVSCFCTGRRSMKNQKYLNIEIALKSEGKTKTLIMSQQSWAHFMQSPLLELLT